MHSKRLYMFTVICSSILLVLTACKGESPSNNYRQNENVTTIENIETAPLSLQPEDNLVFDEDVANIESQEVDYTQYLKKIWVEDHWDTEDDSKFQDYNSYSFVLDKIEAGTVNGGFVEQGVLIPDTLYHEVIASGKNVLVGNIIDNIAICQTLNSEGVQEYLTLIFKENNRIEAINRSVNKKLEKNSIFRSYNIADMYSDINSQMTKSLQVELELWGTVNLVSVIVDSNKPHPLVFLTDENFNILYSFGSSFHSGTDITTVFVEDINGDGLKDIRLIESFIIATDVPDIEWTFYQGENGSFYYIPSETNPIGLIFSKTLNRTGVPLLKQ